MALKVRIRATRQTLGALAAVGIACIAGLLVIAKVDGIGPLARPQFSLVTTLPLAVYPVIALALSLLVVSSRHWWTGLALFFGWLPFEDLVRKFAGNDIRVYFVKDLLLILALIGIAPRLKGCWREPLGKLWWPTMAVFAVALVFSLPSALVSPALPLIGIRVRFFYALLFPIGVYLASDRERLRRATTPLAVLGASVCAIGIAQTLIGPEFLNPSEAEAAPLLNNLVVVKNVGDSEVVRPSGPFADVSRFASMTIVSLTLGLCAFRLADTSRRRQLGALAIVVSLAAAFATGSRTSLLVCLPLAAFGFLFTGRHGLRRSRSTLLLFAAGLVIAGVVAGGAVSEESSQRSDFYAETINPNSENFEIGSRLATYAGAAAGGLRDGGYVGRGTGTESTGKQYLDVDAEQSGAESGWGSVGAEWGVLGLGVWCVWVYLWIRRAIAAARQERDTPAAPTTAIIAFYVGVLLVIMFSFGANFFDNYISNIFFWLLSGVAFAVPAPLRRLRLSSGAAAEATEESSSSRARSQRTSEPIG